MTTSTLAAVRKAAQQRTAADTRYVESLQAARQDGHTLRAIGDAAGVSYQAVHDLLRRHNTRTDVPKPRTFG